MRSVNRKSSIVTRPLAARTMITARMFSCRKEKNPAVFPATVDVSPAA